MAYTMEEQQHGATIELRATNTNSTRTDVDIDDKIHEAYDVDALRGIGNERKMSSSSSSKGMTRRDGHQRLGSSADDVFEPVTISAEAIENAGGTGAATGVGSSSGEEDGIIYKVYKRRWFGLVQLTLLNIVISWDVSSRIPVFFFPVFHGKTQPRDQ
jgi:hypothetical protein